MRRRGGIDVRARAAVVSAPMRPGTASRLRMIVGRFSGTASPDRRSTLAVHRPLGSKSVGAGARLSSIRPVGHLAGYASEAKAGAARLESFHRWGGGADWRRALRIRSTVRPCNTASMRLRSRVSHRSLSSIPRTTCYGGRLRAVLHRRARSSFAAGRSVADRSQSRAACIVDEPFYVPPAI